MTQESLNLILQNTDFNNCITEAAPFRVKIIQDISPRMKDIQKRFQELMIEANYNDVSDILAKLKLDKKDEGAKSDMRVWKKELSLLFRHTLKCIHPNENQKVSIGMIYVAGKLLNYIGRDDIVSSVLEDKNVTINFKKLEDINPKFADDNMKTKLTYLFKEADECQEDMCQNADMIKKNIYDQLPDSIRYSKDSNKKGLKQSNFCSLVRHKAMAVVKDSEKYTKYIEAQVKNTSDTIDREEIMLGKTKQM